MAKPPGSNLSDKQRKFCHEYLKTFNATQAYKNAGYNTTDDAARKSASRLLTKGTIQSYLAELRQKSEENDVINLNSVLKETARLAFSDISKAAKLHGGRVWIKEFDEMDKDTLRAIESVKETRDGQAIKFHSKQSALDSLLRYFGAYSDLNTARQTLKRYGLALEPDPQDPLGWRLERHVIDPNADDLPDADPIPDAPTDQADSLSEGEDEDE